jgi:hypothetical protein
MTAGLALASAIEPADAPIYATDFIREMLRQTRALDSYGQWDGKPAASILAGYVLSKAQKRAHSDRRRPRRADAGPRQSLLQRDRRADRKGMRPDGGALRQITHEGFGRALITVGKLVVMDRTLRDVHRFGFESLSKMKRRSRQVSVCGARHHRPLPRSGRDVRAGR